MFDSTLSITEIYTIFWRFKRKKYIYIQIQITSTTSLVGWSCFQFLSLCFYCVMMPNCVPGDTDCNGNRIRFEFNCYVFVSVFWQNLVQKVLLKWVGNNISTQSLWCMFWFTVQFYNLHMEATTATLYRYTAAHRIRLDHCACTCSYI